MGFRCDAATARGLLEDPDGLDDLLEAEDDAMSVDLDKAWHGLHWLLTGSTDATLTPLSDAGSSAES